MRPIEFVMNSKNLRKPEKGVEWNPTLPALELGSATGFTKGTIIPQKPPADDNLERWRDAAYSFRHTPRVTPLRRTGQLLDGRQMAIEKFTINVSEALLADLRRRLDATRWPDELENVGWELGSSLSYMKSLADYWRNAYEWRRQEATLNQLPQYRVALDGFHVHFVHVRSKNPKPLPLIITHGWPGSFVEMVKLIPLLTDPAAHGGRAEDAFDVIVPSLPGYGFSDRPTERGMNPFKVAALWARLMAELGYERFAAQGGDWGSTISTALGLEHAQHIVGIHLNYIAGRFLLGGTLNQTPDDEIAKSFLAELRAWWDLEGGYSHVQSTKPQTLGYALNDSPVGLAAWIVEKFRTWSQCDDLLGNGDPKLLNTPVL